MKIGFDNEKYLKIQSEHIRERIAQFDGKLYMELGGKLFDDHHASRVLPGFKPDSKLRMLAQLRDSIEIVIVVSADDIEKNKVRADLGITYDEDVLRLRDEFMRRDFMVGSVVITHYHGQHAADQFKHRLEREGIKSYFHYPIDGYPHNVELIASDEGFGKNEFVETSRPLVIVTAPGPGSGKMATCLSQLYNENKRGVRAGYAKFETFPVWNLPLKHPVNIAYEAATADLNDVNMIDPFHLEAYGKTAVNYNRDVEIFPVLNALFEGIYGENPYKSPTDMGVNMIGFCISDDEVCCELLFNQAKISTATRKVTVAAYEKKIQSGHTAAAIELEDGTIITSKSSPLLGCSAALILNATKYLAGIDHEAKLISQSLIEPVQKTKTQYLGAKNPRLHTDEVLVALSVLSQHDENCRRALEQLPKLRDCQVHSTVMLSEVDRKIFKKLGCGLTCDPVKKK